MMAIEKQSRNVIQYLHRSCPFRNPFYVAKMIGVQFGVKFPMSVVLGDAPRPGNWVSASVLTLERDCSRANAHPWLVPMV